MATKYTLYFSDATKPTPSFDLQSYTTNGPISPSNDGLIAGATAANTTLKLWGKGLPEYGEPIFQNLVYMLENFANSSAPVIPIEGQIWYDNSTSGSPSPLPKLKVYDGAAWPAIITANGSSAMTGELILSGDLSLSSDINAATPKQYVDTLVASAAPVVHIHATTDVTDITATFTEINSLVGIGSPVQTQFDNIQVQFVGVQSQFTTVNTELSNKVSRIADTQMADGINVTFNLNGEILGLPPTPSGNTAATSMKYVDDQIASGAGGDGVLSDIIWSNNGGGLGSPPIVIADTTLELTVTHPTNLPTTFVLEGISRTGHIHDAVDVAIDNSFNIAYGANVQTAIEKAEDEIELLKTGGAPPTATIAVQRIFEILTSPLTVAGSPISIFEVQNHNADDNRIALTINGIKQYVHTRGSQSINYSNIVINDSQFTGLDNTLTYEFNISVNGGASTTVTINAGSPLVDLDISTHGQLITAINAELVALSVPATVSLASSGEIFTPDLSGAASIVSITDPGGSPNIYLFDVDSSPDAIIAATFLSGTVSAGSPLTITPDDITIAGDVSAEFPIGRTFTIRNSLDATYGSYDGTYSVHANGANFGGVNTVIPIASIGVSINAIPLLPLYDPTGGSPNPVPAPSPFGDVYLTPLAGIDSVAAGVNGLDGDYAETDIFGNPVAPSGFSSYVVFNYDILTGSKIESLLYV